MNRILIAACVALAFNAFAGDVLVPVSLPVGFTVASGTTKALAVAATATLTFTGNAVDGETVTIGPKTYTFKTNLVNADGYVLIGASATNSATNLVAAIDLGAGSGTTYAASTTPHPSVFAAVGTGSAVVVTALASGPTGNSIPISETVALASFPLGQKSLASGSVVEAPILPMNGLGVEITVVGTNAVVGVVSNAVFNFALSAGGTNFATTSPGTFSVNVPPNGKTNQTVFTNIPATIVGNARRVRLVSVNNQDTNGAITVVAVPISDSFNQ